MAFEWLSSFHRHSNKTPDYAEKALAAYRLGMRAKGSILGVAVSAGSDCCEAARSLPPDELYHPDNAPRLPLPDCPQKSRCACVYRPVMTYQKNARSTASK